MPSKPDILLACYGFPPNQGIGGRRAAKFAKQLAAWGHQVHVIKADPPEGNQPSPWTEEVAHPNITVHSLAIAYPQAISHPKPGIAGKVLFRYHRWRLEQVEKGTIFDVAIGWDEAFFAKANALIQQHNIGHVVATGAPFNLLYYAAQLKQQHPQIKLVCEYRDPWLTARNYGMANLVPARKREELRKQHTVFQWADAVTCPNDFMLKEIRESDPEHATAKAHFQSIEHFFDPDDIIPYATAQKGDSEELLIVYGGAVYAEVEPYMPRLVENLDHLQQAHPALYARLRIEIYTPDQHKKHLFGDHKVVHFFQPVGKQLFERIVQANYVLVLLADHNRHFKTTKFVEYLALGTPMLYLGPEGHVHQSIKEEQLGAILAQKTDLANLLTNPNQQPNITADHDRYSLATATHKLLTLLGVHH